MCDIIDAYLLIGNSIKTICREFLVIFGQMKATNI